MKSNCCNAEMKEVGTPDFIGSDEVCTVHWECQKCKQPCDPEIDFSKGPQKPWNFNIEGMIKASNKLNMTKHNKTVEEILQKLCPFKDAKWAVRGIAGEEYIDKETVLEAMRLARSEGREEAEREHLDSLERVQNIAEQLDDVSWQLLGGRFNELTNKFNHRPAEEE